MISALCVLHNSTCSSTVSSFQSSRGSGMLRLRGGISMSEIGQELGKIEVESAERMEQIRAINSSIAERWEAMQERFNEEAEKLSVTGYVDPEEMEGEYLAGIIEMLHEEPTGLTRRNYTDEDPFVNPCKKTRDFMDWWLKRTPKEVYDDLKESIASR
jgi:hypothetical protein